MEKGLKATLPYRPRLSIEITMQQKEKLNDLIPWGMQKAIFSILIDQLIEALEKRPAATLAALLSKELTVNDLIGLKGGSKNDN